MKLTRRAFVKSLSLTIIGVSSCSPSSKERAGQKPDIALEKSPIPIRGKARRHDTDAIPTPEDVVVRMKVTAYCPCSKCCGIFADGITASGHHIMKGDRFVAADKCYPFGTEMYIPGYCPQLIHPESYYGEMVAVLDRGGAIYDNHIDVYFDTHQEALNWGVKYLDVVVLSFSRSEYEQ